MAPTCAKTAELMMVLLNGRHGVQNCRTDRDVVCRHPRHDWFTDMNHGHVVIKGHNRESCKNGWTDREARQTRVMSFQTRCRNSIHPHMLYRSIEWRRHAQKRQNQWIDLLNNWHGAKFVTISVYLVYFCSCDRLSVHCSRGKVLCNLLRHQFT